MAQKQRERNVSLKHAETKLQADFRALLVLRELYGILFARAQFNCVECFNTAVRLTCSLVREILMGCQELAIC